LLFLLCTNDSSIIINSKSTPTLYADDTRLLFTHSNLEDYKNDRKIVFEYLNKWFKAHRISRNSEKINFIQSATKNSPQIDFDIGYDNKLISKVNDTKFLRSHVDSTLSWKTSTKKTLHKLTP
jgi:hypothetical protein